MPTADEIIAEAQKHLGKRYVFGSRGPNTFDCSGLVSYVYGKFNIHLPAYTQTMVKRGKTVSKNDIQPGDIVFMNWGRGPNSHVGIAVSSTRIIDAPNSRQRVRYHDIGGSSWAAGTITTVKRMPGVTQGNGQGLTPNGVANGGTATAGGGSSGGTTSPSSGSSGASSAGGGSSGGGALDKLKQAITDAFAPLTGLETVANGITGLFMPTMIIRIVCGIVGMILIGWGAVKLTKETVSA